MKGRELRDSVYLFTSVLVVLSFLILVRWDGMNIPREASQPNTPIPTGMTGASRSVSRIVFHCFTSSGAGDRRMAGVVLMECEAVTP